MMLRITDNTLTGFDKCLPSKEELHLFCRLLRDIGVDVIEISLAVYEKMNYMPVDGKYNIKVENEE